MRRHHYDFVLGLHLTAGGFGWALFDGPSSAYDWGTADIREDKESQCLARYRRILVRYRPSALAIEAFEEGHARRAQRIRLLYRALIQEAQESGIPVHIYSKTERASAVGLSGLRSRQQVAEAIAYRIPALRPRLPARRKVWEGEKPGMAVFCAAACVLAHYAAPQKP